MWSGCSDYDGLTKAASRNPFLLNSKIQTCLTPAEIVASRYLWHIAETLLPVGPFLLQGCKKMTPSTAVDSRPSFALAWAASSRIYDRNDPLGKVAEVIGGKVAFNISGTSEKFRWKNTCAVRISYILNESGLRIPAAGLETVSGTNGRWYFYRVIALIAFLKKEWGEPDLVIDNPQEHTKQLIGKKGLLIFEVDGWSDAAGHASLWNGNGQCYDNCYFNSAVATYSSRRLSFWELK